MGDRDSISNLPDEILGKILSALPTKLVASTSVLSKRWRNLFRFVENLDFTGPDPECQPTPGHCFTCFMLRKFLMLSNPPCIKKFSLNCRYGNYNDVHNWIRTALERGCLELHLQCQSDRCLDLKVFSNNTLVKLTLSDGIFIVDDFTLHHHHPEEAGAFFPKLKSLSLDIVWMSCDLYELLIESCPLLEELNIRDENYPFTWKGYVSSGSIKRLSVSVVEIQDNKESPQAVWFDAPTLVHLDYSCYVSSHYDVVDLDSLVEARLDIRLWEESTTIDGDSDLGDVTDLVAGIRNINTLYLSPHSLEVFYLCCKSMPVFNNLLRLYIESDEERGWQIVPLLLKRSPNLQTLVIKGLLHKVTNRCGDVCVCVPKKRKMMMMMMEEEQVSCLSTCRVKVLEISGYGGTCKELKQMRHFLGKLKYLETVKISLQFEKNDNYWPRVTNDLKKLPRVSSKCQIHFF